MNSLRENTVLDLHAVFHHMTQTPNTNKSNAFSKMLFLTSCRHAVSLSKIINRFLSKKIPNKHALAETVLITATAEMLFMESPEYAVINSYVDIAKKHCGKALSGLINAVLRNIARQKQNLLKHYHAQSFPDSFKKILAKDYSPETIAKIEKVASLEPMLNITVKNNPEQWAQKLKGKIIAHNNIALPNTGKIEKIEGYVEGEWWVQDFAASLAVLQFNNVKNLRILDLCAAPGGKTAQLISAGAKVTSLDCSEERLKTLKTNLERLHLEPEKIICADAVDYLKNFNDVPFDAILLDAPCSATGVFRRHPEILYNKTMDDVIKQSHLQQTILENISPALKPNGELIYCTCSISKTEGEEQIKKFTATHKNFKISPITDKNDFIRTLPYEYAQTGGCDAFFIAKLLKDA